MQVSHRKRRILQMKTSINNGINEIKITKLMNVVPDAFFSSLKRVRVDTTLYINKFAISIVKIRNKLLQ